MIGRGQVGATGPVGVVLLLVWILALLVWILAAAAVMLIKPVREAKARPAGLASEASLAS